MELTSQGAVFSFPLDKEGERHILSQVLRDEDAQPQSFPFEAPDNLNDISFYERHTWLQETAAQHRQAVEAYIENVGEYVCEMLAAGFLMRRVPFETLDHPEARCWLEAGLSGQILVKFQSPTYRGQKKVPRKKKPTPQPAETSHVAASNGIDISKMDLTREALPKPKEFKPALVKVLGQMTNNTPKVYVRSEDAIERVLAELGIPVDGCPWTMRGKPSVHRNIGYAYRNSKEGYKASNPFFVASTDSGKWALNDLGAQEAAKYNPGGSVPSGVVSEPVMRSNKPISPEDNRTLRWLNEQGTQFVEELKAFAAPRFPRSVQLSKIEDHVQTFLLELIAEDKIGGYHDRNGKWPKQTNVLSWWQRNSITSQLRAEGKEPVCMANHGAMTDSRRKAAEKGDTSWAKTPVGTPKVYTGTSDNPSLEFIGGDLEDEMVKQLDSDSFLETVGRKLDEFPDGDVYQQIMRGLSDGGTHCEILQELALPDGTMEEAMIHIRTSAERAQRERA